MLHNDPTGANLWGSRLERVKFDVRLHLWDGSLPLDSFRVVRMQATEAVGHFRSEPEQIVLITNHDPGNGLRGIDRFPL
jgi:hypothetical protein